MKYRNLIGVLFDDSLFRAVFIYAIVSLVTVSVMFFMVFSMHFPVVEEFLYDHISDGEAFIVYGFLEDTFSKTLRGFAFFYLFSTFLAVLSAYRYARK